MANTADAVMAMVEEELKKNPSVSSEELFQKAKQLDESISQLNIRQFHARYPLQVKRRAAAAKKPAKAAAAQAKPKSRRAAEPAQRQRQRRGPGRPRAAARVQAAAGADREAIRTVLLQFAEAVASAEDAGELVKIIGGVDRYVDRVARAAGVQ